MKNTERALLKAPDLVKILSHKNTQMGWIILYGQGEEMVYKKGNTTRCLPNRMTVWGLWRPVPPATDLLLCICYAQRQWPKKFPITETVNDMVREMLLEQWLTAVNNKKSLSTPWIRDKEIWKAISTKSKIKTCFFLLTSPWVIKSK